VLVDPSGKALPCHAAWVIPGLQFENVRDHSLEWIWRESDSFQKFRGEQWMPEPCRSCDRRSQDCGGCRCQAMLITGDATATDPACSLAPGHFQIEEQLQRMNASANSTPANKAHENAPEDFWTYRPQPR
jgi:pyrroloquinoline quinone biosynthesis protein E